MPGKPGCNLCFMPQLYLNSLFTWIPNITRLQSMVHHRKYTLLSLPKHLQSFWSCYVQPFSRRCIHKKVHYFTFDLDLCTCKIWSCYVQRFRRKCIYKKYLIWPWPRPHEALPSTSYDLCTCKVWSCYCQWLRRRCIFKKNILLDLDLGVKVTQNVAEYPPHHVTLVHQQVLRRCIYKKIHYLTFRSGSHKMLPSAFHSMWHMHLQSLKLLRQKL